MSAESPESASPGDASPGTYTPGPEIGGPPADRPGPVQKALEADLSAWGAEKGSLAQVARQIAQKLDQAPLGEGLTDLSRELRQLVKSLRETAAAPSEVDRFLAEIAADGFDGRH